MSRKFVCDRASEACKAAGCLDAVGRTWMVRGATWVERRWMAENGVWRCSEMHVDTRLVPYTEPEEVPHDGK